jgi:hypothetical protein
MEFNDSIEMQLFNHPMPASIVQSWLFRKGIF